MADSGRSAGTARSRAANVRFRPRADIGEGMDWHFVLFTVRQGLPGAAALAMTLPVFAVCGNPGRRLLASSSTLAAMGAFVASAVVAGIPGVEAATWGAYVPMIGFGVALLLLVPSVRALRLRWFGVLHLVTMVASIYLAFIGSLAISHDAT